MNSNREPNPTRDKITTIVASVFVVGLALILLAVIGAFAWVLIQGLLDSI